MVRCAKDFGLKARVLTATWERLGAMALPGIVGLRQGGFLILGKIMADRQPADLMERRRAYALGWSTGFVVLASFAFMLVNYFTSSNGLG